MNPRVLIVEDEILVADDLEWQLTRMGYEVLAVASTGAEAIALANDRRPDIVLMDIQLQGPMTGIEAAQVIRERTGASLIFVTAFAAVFLREPGEMQRPGICLSKPFSKLQLKAALDATVRQTRNN